MIYVVCFTLFNPIGTFSTRVSDSHLMSIYLHLLLKNRGYFCFPHPLFQWEVRRHSSSLPSGCDVGSGDVLSVRPH